MALYILAIMLVGIVTVALTMHYGLAALGMLPDFASGRDPGEREFFQVNYQLALNIVFLLTTAALLWLYRLGKQQDSGHHHHDHGGASLTDKVLRILSALAALWLAGGAALMLF